MNAKLYEPRITQLEKMKIRLRLRHPKSAPSTGVTVNGKPWTTYNKAKEHIILKGLTGTVSVTAQY